MITPHRQLEMDNEEKLLLESLDELAPCLAKFYTVIPEQYREELLKLGHRMARVRKRVERRLRQRGQL